MTVIIEVCACLGLGGQKLTGREESGQAVAEGHNVAWENVVGYVQGCVSALTY